MNLTDLAATVLQHQRSTPDLIAEALRQAIQIGIFQAGQSLRQDEIATQFGVSRIPVREALRQLEMEGLVTFHPNRGAMVSILSSAEVQEICEIRISLETLALQLAMPHLGNAALEQAAALLDATEQTADPGQWAALNWQFHAVLYLPAQRPRLLNLMKTLHVNIDRYIRFQLQEPNYREHSQIEHHQLLAACRQQNLPLATAILQQHISNTAHHLVTYLQSAQQAKPALRSGSLLLSPAIPAAHSTSI
jgi:DNA-binding GntR family transcriptional regulator